MKSPICRDPALSYWPPGILGDHFFQQLIPVHPAIQNCISNWTYKLKETKKDIDYDDDDKNDDGREI